MTISSAMSCTLDKQREMYLSSFFTIMQRVSLHSAFPLIFSPFPILELLIEPRPFRSAVHRDDDRTHPSDGRFGSFRIPFLKSPDSPLRNRMRLEFARAFRNEFFVRSVTVFISRKCRSYICFCSSSKLIIKNRRPPVSICQRHNAENSLISSL